VKQAPDAQKQIIFLDRAQHAAAGSLSEPVSIDTAYMALGLRVSLAARRRGR
jgi:hypothetical protein